MDPCLVSLMRCNFYYVYLNPTGLYLFFVCQVVINTLLYLIGVAYSRHLVQIYSYHGGEEVRQHLEVCIAVRILNEILSLLVFLIAQD